MSDLSDLIADNLIPTDSWFEKPSYVSTRRPGWRLSQVNVVFPLGFNSFYIRTFLLGTTGPLLSPLPVRSHFVGPEEFGIRRWGSVFIEN